MKKITISDEQFAELGGSEPASEVHDAAGRLVGYFVTPTVYAELMAAKEAADIAELDRRAQDKDVGTLKDLWQELGVE